MRQCRVLTFPQPLAPITTSSAAGRVPPSGEPECIGLATAAEWRGPRDCGTAEARVLGEAESDSSLGLHHSKLGGDKPRCRPLRGPS